MARGCLLVLCLWFGFAQAHVCKHDSIAEDLEYVQIEQEYSSTPRDKATYQNLNLDIRYDLTGSCSYTGQIISRRTGCSAVESPYTCAAEDVITSTKLTEFQTNIVPQMAAFWQSTLQVSGSGLTISSSCCGVTTTVTTSSGSFVLFVTFYPTDKSSTGDTTTLAWATACSFDTTGRPIAGQINFGPNGISSAITDVKRSENFHVAVHEMAHALGFSNSLFSTYKQLDSSGNLVAYSQVVGTFTENGHTVKKIVTPKVIQQVLSHFGCSALTNNGAEIEDGGGSGTQYSHWEKRIFNNEFMTGTSSNRLVISPLTLALFEDMGWYQVSYDNPNVQPLPWGNGLGCLFAQGKCSSSWSSEYFCRASNCSSTQYLGCSPDHAAKAHCNLAAYSSSLASYYQYFSDPTIGASDQLMDYCPTYEGYSNGLCSDYSNTNTSYISEYFATDSRCFLSTALQTGQSAYRTDGCGHHTYVACHRTSCVNNNSPSAVLRVFFGSSNADFIDCPQTGGQVDIYSSLVTTSGVACEDVSGWTYAGNDCSYFASAPGGCSSYVEYGQSTYCKRSCGYCADFEGTLTCPPVDSLCSTAGSSASTSATTSLSPSRSTSASPSRFTSHSPTTSKSPTTSVTASASTSASTSASRSTTNSKTPTVSSTTSASSSPSPTRSASVSVSRTAGYKCVACAVGWYAASCSPTSQGNCTDCLSLTACAVGKRRDGCGVTSPGNCIACEVCPIGQVRIGCSGTSAGVCALVSPTSSDSASVSVSPSSSNTIGTTSDSSKKKSSSSGVAIGVGVAIGSVLLGAAFLGFTLCYRNRTATAASKSTRVGATALAPIAQAHELSSLPQQPLSQRPLPRAPLPSAPLPPPPPSHAPGFRTSPWQQYVANDGNAYYHNATTNETTWDRPLDF